MSLPGVVQPGTGLGPATGPTGDREIKLEVVRKDVVAEGVLTLSLRHPDGRRLPDWAPGAHIDLVLPNGVVRQYSLCGDRWDAHTYRVGVLREADGRGGSAYIHDELQPGALVAVGGPRNNFHLVPSGRYLFIAGGIGITPLLFMVRQADMVGADWHLLYGGRTRASMGFLDELEKYGDRVQVCPQDTDGLLDLPGALERHGTQARVYVCGPSPLLDAVEALSAAWPSGVLRTERFVAKEQAAPARDVAFEVELVRSGLSVTVTPNSSILDAVRSAGVQVLSSCREGTCGTCEAGVLAGRPDHRDSILDDAERAANDCMFVCVSRSCGDRLALDL